MTTDRTSSSTLPGRARTLLAAIHADTHPGLDVTDGLLTITDLPAAVRALGMGTAALRRALDELVRAGHLDRVKATRVRPPAWVIRKAPDLPAPADTAPACPACGSPGTVRSTRTLPSGLTVRDLAHPRTVGCVGVAHAYGTGTPLVLVTHPGDTAGQVTP